MTTRSAVKIVKEKISLLQSRTSDLWITNLNHIVKELFLCLTFALIIIGSDGFIGVRAEARGGAYYGMKSDFVKGRQQLLEPFIIVHNKIRSFRSV
jgi:hypothetical protein